MPVQEESLFLSVITRYLGDGLSYSPLLLGVCTWYISIFIADI